MFPFVVFAHVVAPTWKVPTFEYQPIHQKLIHQKNHHVQLAECETDKFTSHQISNQILSHCNATVQFVVIIQKLFMLKIQGVWFEDVQEIVQLVNSKMFWLQTKVFVQSLWYK